MAGSVTTRTRLLLPVLSLAAAVILGLVALTAGRLIGDAVADESLSGARTASAVFADATLQSDEFTRDGRLTGEAKQDIAQFVEGSGEVLNAGVYTPAGRLEFQTRAEKEDLAERSKRAVRRAALGEVVDQTEHGDVSSLDVLSVFRPVYVTGHVGAIAVLEVELPYSAVRSEISERKRRTYLVIGIAALLIYASLLPLLVTGARATAQAGRNAAISNSITKAIERREFHLEYQPKIDLHSGSVRGVEALLRWRHPKRGPVAPMEFLPAAEQTDAIVPLTLHVAELAYAQLAQWHRRGLDIELAINLAPTVITAPDIAQRLVAIATRCGLEVDSLILEVTESTLTEPEAIEALDDLRAYGFRLSIDDFGTGYSSLWRLQGLTLDELKIDRAFVRDLEHGRGETVLATVVELGQKLGLHVVAEGVESPDVVDHLAEIGCDAAQGFHFSRPLPAAELERWLERSGREYPGTVAGAHWSSPAAQ